MSDNYVSPLVERFATAPMKKLWGAQKKFSTWRRCWVALAEAERELGLEITEAQVEALRAHIDDIDFEKAGAYEKETRHDVMAHIHTYGDAAPEARAIIHLGATSCYVGDNTDLILMREGLNLILDKVAAVLSRLCRFALEYKDLAALGFTHYQPAQLVTVGKRACLWAQDLLLDGLQMERQLPDLRCRGVKGATGTQASFMALFNGDEEKVLALDRLVAQKLGFDQAFTITGQTYTRKLDTQVLNALAGIGESAHKFGTDMRLLQNLKEVEEPFESTQVGSSAMPYKRNPMRSERICALSRFLITAPLHGAFTSAVQWFERTLDDSAIRRLSVPEAFLAADAILNLYLNVMEKPRVYPRVIEKRIWSELPFMASENILMACVQRGGDRQTLHETIRRHAQEAGRRVKEEGADNDLLERLAADPVIGMTREEMEKILDVRRFVGRAPAQVVQFIEEEVEPFLKRRGAHGEVSSDVRV
ncbi:MAG TPA: adenylosuccinate lyase [Candidatus Hydrogenedentes bacterium]|jgi:adenylosuccinate lyase|nr:adenylosuccinate lyase [Candidatus Hydrogenedentota bacterium]HQM99465.1 adenylosuccinate lyase [Candidatus Hydrogenedentota bacterium]